MNADEKAAVIREWRRVLGLTVVEAAVRMKVTRTTVWRWERGACSPPRGKWVEVLEELVELLVQRKGEE